MVWLLLMLLPMLLPGQGTFDAALMLLLPAHVLDAASDANAELKSQKE